MAAMTQHVDTAVHDMATRAKDAQRQLARTSSGAKAQLLAGLAAELEAASDRIVAANAVDLARGRREGMTAGLLDRLELTPARVAAIAASLREVAALPDPIGEIVRGSTLPNGLKLRQERVPMGVVGMIYEARPNVTVDAAGLALKAGNAVLLRGGSAAAESNRVIVAALQDGLEAAGFSRDLVQSVDDFGREGAVALMHAHGDVDLLVPRGGANLIATVVREARVPVIETGTGNVHIYVDASADLEKALPIVINAKTQRVGVCNAAESLLVHEQVAAEFVPRVALALREKGVRMHADEATRALTAGLEEATEADWETEYLSLDIAMRVVPSIDEAIAHIHRYSTGHTEVIVTETLAAAEQFTQEVDAAVVMVNTSSRFTDGGEFGLGAELGISTQKLHARGPMGLAELTTTKWIVLGSGQVRS